MSFQPPTRKQCKTGMVEGSSLLLKAAPTLAEYAENKEALTDFLRIYKSNPRGFHAKKIWLRICNQAEAVKELWGGYKKENEQMDIDLEHEIAMDEKKILEMQANVAIKKMKFKNLRSEYQQGNCVKDSLLEVAKTVDTIADVEASRLWSDVTVYVSLS